MNSKILHVLSSTRLTATLLFALLSLVVAQSPADEANPLIISPSALAVDSATNLRIKLNKLIKEVEELRIKYEAALVNELPKSPTAAIDSANALPELGTPAANTASVQPNINAQGAGFNYRDNIDGKLISINPQYSKQTGASLGVSFATPVAKNMAVSILLTAGSEKNEWLLNTGFDLTSNQRFIFSFGQLSQKLDFNFLSGNQKTTVRQDNIAGSYQYFLGKDWLNAAEVNAYLSNTGSITLGDKTYFIDTASLYELWRDPRRIAGGRITGAQGRLVFTPTSKTTIKVGLGAERLTYDYFTGNESTTRATGSAELVQRLDNDFNFRASANAGASQSRYTLGLGRRFKDGAQFGIDVATIQGRDNTFNDNQLMLNYSQSFGGNNASTFGNSSMGMNNQAINNLDASGAPMNQAYANSAPANMATPNANANTWASSLVDQVSRRPSFLPSQVIAKVDNTATPTRLIAIDKTAVPVGSSINNATGLITTPIGTPVSGIAGLTKNGFAFTNFGQFALSGTTALVINPNLITQPAVGVIDTYVVTMNNNSGFGTTLATVVISHGSTKIDSIVMSDGTITPTLSGLGLSASSVVFGAIAPTITAPTSASSGAITYTSGTVGTATITNAGVITIVGVGSTMITATQAANGNYAASTTTTNLTVTAATPSLTGLGLSATSVVFGATAPTITPPTSANTGGAITYSSDTFGTATITSAGVITIAGVGSTVITATQAANGNYASSTTTITLTVTAATPSLSGLGLSASSVVFGAAAPTITAPSSASSGAITYTSDTVGTATITSGGVITIAGVGTTVITATQAANGNYAASSTTTTLTITAATPSLTGLDLSASSVVFGAVAPTITAPTSASSGAITYTSDTAGTATINNAGVITIAGVGTTVITATQAANGNYASASTTTTLTVTTATPSLTSFGAISKTYGNAAFGLTAPTSASSGAFTYTSSDTAVATISGSTVTVVGAGTSTITATQAANANYATASTTATLTVTTATPSLTSFGAISKTYGDAAFGLTAPTSASSGAFTYTSSNTAVATISGSTITVVGAGTSTITATQAANGNYAASSTTTTLTVTAATQSLTGLGLNASSVVFGAAAPTITAPSSASSGAITYTSGTVGTATITSGGVITIIGVGTTVITATQAANGNYASASTTATLTVTAAAATLSGLGLSTSSVVFGAAAPTITAPTSASSGAITYTSGTAGTATINNAGVITIAGVGSTVITATQAANGNYATASTTITLTVTAATPSLTSFGAISKTYGNAAFSLTAPTSASSGAFTYTSSDTAVATISGSTVTVVGAGTSTITVTQAANVNYASASTTATLTVGGVMPSLNGFGAISKTYGDTAFGLTAPTSASSGAFTYTSSNTAVATISGSTITVVGAGTSTITATQAANGNYASASTTATLTVGGVTPSLTGFGLSASSVVFGAAAPTITAPTSASAGAITYTSSNLDTAFMNNSYTGVMSLTGVGTAVITATQAANGNYTSTTTSITLTVTAANPLDGALVSGGLTFTRNNSTVPRGGMSNWTGANSTCSNLTTPGLPAGSWRLPLAIELLMLQSAGIQQLITADWGLNRTWTSEQKDSSNHIFLSLDFGTIGWDLDNKGYYVSCVH